MTPIDEPAAEIDTNVSLLKASRHCWRSSFGLLMDRSNMAAMRRAIVPWLRQKQISVDSSLPNNATTAEHLRCGATW
ncbi:MAG: hypothetical protein ABUS79_10035 [Pseudomonadota bacterium]